MLVVGNYYLNHCLIWGTKLQVKNISYSASIYFSQLSLQIQTKVVSHTEKNMILVYIHFYKLMYCLILAA